MLPAAFDRVWDGPVGDLGSQDSHGRLPLPDPRAPAVCQLAPRGEAVHVQPHRRLPHHLDCEATRTQTNLYHFPARWVLKHPSPCQIGTLFYCNTEDLVSTRGIRWYSSLITYKKVIVLFCFLLYFSVLIPNLIFFFLRSHLFFKT